MTLAWADLLDELEARVARAEAALAAETTAPVEFEPLTCDAPLPPALEDRTRSLLGRVQELDRRCSEGAATLRDELRRRPRTHPPARRAIGHFEVGA